MVKQRVGEKGECRLYNSEGSGPQWRPVMDAHGRPWSKWPIALYSSLDRCQIYFTVKSVEHMFSRLYCCFYISSYSIHIAFFPPKAGYIGSVSFLEKVLHVVEKLRTVNPNLIYGMGKLTNIIWTHVVNFTSELSLEAYISNMTNMIDGIHVVMGWFYM